MVTLILILVITCDLHSEILLYFFKNYRTVLHSLKFRTSQIITIILNSLQ